MIARFAADPGMPTLPALMPDIDRCFSADSVAEIEAKLDTESLVDQTLLYAMRVSAKLNLYLGVRNLALDFLPPHLLYLGSYFRQRPFNRLMPWSLLAGAVVAGWLIVGAQATTGGAQAAHLLLASLLTLALVEHLMMVLPLEPSALWRWALRRPAEARS